MNTDPWTICQWCWKDIESSSIPNWHEECITKISEFMERIQREQEIEND